jgi:hypothetical protein
VRVRPLPSVGAAFEKPRLRCWGFSFACSRVPGIVEGLSNGCRSALPCHTGERPERRQLTAPHCLLPPLQWRLGNHPGAGQPPLLPVLADPGRHAAPTVPQLPVRADADPLPAAQRWEGRREDCRQKSACSRGVSEGIFNDSDVRCLGPDSCPLGARRTFGRIARRVEWAYTASSAASPSP